jgi:hypothetical protein
MGAQQSCKACATCAADCAREEKDLADDLGDDDLPSDPAGAIFEETLDDVCLIDRQLMHFCASKNLAAVRWLIHLGANRAARDRNGTTCLHVACRSGTLAIAEEMMEARGLVQAVDVAGWTPLHVAVLMARREVVVSLLRAGAPPAKANCRGQLPSDLCADNGTFDALQSYQQHLLAAPGKPWVDGENLGQVEDTVTGKLEYEPFFVPRTHIIKVHQFKKEYQKLGVAIFNKSPGHGLGFLVATGATRDYPVDISSFLRRAKVDPAEVGSFLGEGYSLSHTIRLELFNSLALQNTGVIGALKVACQLVELPDDLQKINRLVQGVSRIWWRQHEKLAKERTRMGEVSSFSQEDVDDLELTGLCLKQYLPCSDTLYQLMFSAVLLHWYVFKDGSVPPRDMDFPRWRALNRGIENGIAEIPDVLQQGIHAKATKAFIREIAVGRSSANRVVEGGPDEGGGHDPKEKAKPSILASHAAVEGWAQIIGGFPRWAGATPARETGQVRQHTSDMFSEVTFRKGDSAPILSVLSGHVSLPALAAVHDLPGQPGRDGNDATWLSICYKLLFFCNAPPNASPYACLELDQVSVQSMHPSAGTIVLAGAIDRDGLDAIQSQIRIVLLLPDGRWQELHVATLELKFLNSEQLTLWSTHLMAACQRQGNEGFTNKERFGSPVKKPIMLDQRADEHLAMNGSVASTSQRAPLKPHQHPAGDDDLQL